MPEVATPGISLMRKAELGKPTCYPNDIV